MKKTELDERICDCEEKATNIDTYREFIVYGIHEIYGADAKIPDLDNMNEQHLNELIDDLDYLLGK